MSDVSPDTIEYRTPCRLSDLLKLHVCCTFYSSAYVWIIFAVLFVVLLVMSIGAAGSSGDPPNFYIALLIGLAAGFGAGPAIIVARRAMGRIPKEIEADITAEGVKAIGEAFNYEAKWPSLSWVKEGKSAYLLKFKKLFIRLPKRGFASGQDARFRALVGQHAPPAANRLKS